MHQLTPSKQTHNEQENLVTPPSGVVNSPLKMKRKRRSALFSRKNHMIGIKTPDIFKRREEVLLEKTDEDEIVCATPDFLKKEIVADPKFTLQQHLEQIQKDLNEEVVFKVVNTTEIKKIKEPSCSPTEEVPKEKSQEDPVFQNEEIYALASITPTVPVPPSKPKKKRARFNTKEILQNKVEYYESKFLKKGAQLNEITEKLEKVEKEKTVLETMFCDMVSDHNRRENELEEENKELKEELADKQSYINEIDGTLKKLMTANMKLKIRVYTNENKKLIPLSWIENSFTPEKYKRIATNYNIQKTIEKHNNIKKENN